MFVISVLLSQVMRRKEVEHVRDKSMLQEKIKSLEAQLLEVRLTILATKQSAMTTVKMTQNKGCT